jgi:cytochrome c5
MKRFALVILVVIASIGVAMAQTDVLGAHNGYGRGCVMCHAPHSGSLGNGLAATKDPQNGMFALWGQDLTPLFGQSFCFSGDGKCSYPVTLPASGTITSAHDANTIILFCLSCHDGVLTSVGMMKGQTVETLPIVGGTAPTLLAKAAPTQGAAYNNDHPVGGSAIVNCGGGYNWDCAGGNTLPINMTGPASSQFILNYKGSFWNTGAISGQNQKLATFGNVVTAVTCTTCHDQHSMIVYQNNNGNFNTMFFVKGQYTPLAGGNAVAQFCRNCHGGESNEMHGLMNVPTV